MIGQLPPDFFHQFFAILDTSPAKALELEQKINNLCQRKWLQAQMEVLPEMERESFGRILTQDGVSVVTLNEFLEQRLDQEQRIKLWNQALLEIWGQILQIVERSATAEQRKRIRELVEKYRG